MKAVRIHENRGPANPELLVFEDAPDPQAATGDVIVRVHATSFVPDELDWPGTWTDRAGRDRTPSIPAHEVAGVVTEVGYGTTGVRHHRRRRARPIGRDRQAGRRAGLDQCAAPGDTTRRTSSLLHRRTRPVSAREARTAHLAGVPAPTRRRRPPARRDTGSVPVQTAGRAGQGGPRRPACGVADLGGSPERRAFQRRGEFSRRLWSVLV